MVSEKGGRGALITPSWAELPQPAKSGWRPPVYNGEDYAVGLLWRRGDSSKGCPPPPQHHEMTLRQFTSTQDLLAKLNNDLKHAYPSFVQEFVGSTVDGCTLLLEVLRGVSGGNTGTSTRAAALEELASLECLALCMARSQDAPRKIAASSVGLFGVAAALLSSLNKSRILALQIMKKVCESGNGHNSVEEALSTVRLRFGEPGRFRFLTGILSSAGAPALLLAGMAFVNSFVMSAPDSQTQLYIQAELHHAGYTPQLYIKCLANKSPCEDDLRQELARWQKMYVDVNKLRCREGELNKEVTGLKDKLTHLERKLQILEEEKCRSESGLKRRCAELEREVSTLRGQRGTSSPAEDEGISSSGQDPEQEPLLYEVYTTSDTILIDAKDKEDEETTIEEVMEELQNIINDAETDYKEKTESRIKEKILAKHYTRYIQPNNMKQIEVPKETKEKEIVPERLLPHPPRKTRNLFFERNYGNSLFFEDEEESMENSDSLLSASNENLYQEGVRKAEESMRRRDTFHHPGVIPPTEILPEIKSRRGSFDGLFYFAEETKPTGTRIYVEAKQEERSKSKSLDRIKEGLDTMVDIVEVSGGPRYPSERTMFLPQRADPSPTSSQKLVVKRAQPNAGLYSGTALRQDYYARSLNALGRLNIGAPGGKLSDLPSGLY